MQQPTRPEAVLEKSSSPLNVHLISHNHWDREWIFTATYANQWLPTFFDNLFGRLEEQPDYRFVLDGQTLIIEDYLRQLPPSEAAARDRDIRRFVQSGQLQVGPAYLQPDWSLVSGESLIRNLLIGHKMATHYGETMKAGWLLDNFGQIAQTPQIFRGFGIPGVFLWRGVEMPPDQLRTEFWWEAPDGSRILGIYLLDSYRNAMVLSQTREIAVERILAHTNTLRRFASTPNVLLMNGYEQVPEPDDVLPIIAEANERLAPELRVLQSTPPEFLDAVLEHDPELPVLSGYLYSGRYAPVLKGVYSSRSYLNQMNNDCQRELERWAEKFNTFAWAFGFDYPERRFEQSWKTLLLNHTHDDLCGCCIDPIARDMESRFEEVDRAARTMSSESMQAIASSVNTAQAGCHAALIVFNPSSRPRSEVTGLSLELPSHMEAFTIRDRDGRAIPYQLVNRIGRLAELYLWTGKVPPVGYKTFYLHEDTVVNGAVEHPTVSASAEERTLENEWLQVKINPDGSLRLFDKVRQMSYDNLGYFQDGGDCGDTYDYSYPRQDQVITSLRGVAKITLVEEGPLLASFRVEHVLEVPRSLDESRTARSEATIEYPIVSFVELAAGSRHVGIRTVVNNVARDHRLRVLFPSGVDTDTSHAGAAFDVARFPVRDSETDGELPPELGGLMLAGRYTASVDTRPFQNFVSLIDEQKSLHVFSRGLSEYEILPEQNTIALTLIRGVGWLARPDLLTRIGDVGPHILTPEAQCLGIQTFDYAIYPHGNDLRLANPQFESDRQTLGLRAVQTVPHVGSLPDQYSFLSWIEEEPSGALKLAAMKLADSGDGLIVRFYNALDEDARGRLRVSGQVSRAWHTDLKEEPIEELPVDDWTVEFKLRGKEIYTVKILLTPWNSIDDRVQHAAHIVPSIVPDAALPVVEMPAILTEAEVAEEETRAARLSVQLMEIRSQAYELSEAVQRGESAIAQLAELQRLKGQEATLARQSYEAEISALLNRRLLVEQEIKSELGELGEKLNWARVRKRVGEFLIHYYDSLLQDETPPDGSDRAG